MSTWRATADAEKLEQVVELAVDISDNCHWCRDVGHILVALQDFLGLHKDEAFSSSQKGERHETPALKRTEEEWGWGHASESSKQEVRGKGRSDTFSQRRTTSSSSSGLQSITLAICRSRSSISVASMVPRCELPRLH